MEDLKTLARRLFLGEEPAPPAVVQEATSLRRISTSHASSASSVRVMVKRAPVIKTKLPTLRPKFVTPKVRWHHSHKIRGKCLWHSQSLMAEHSSRATFNGDTRHPTGP